MPPKKREKDVDASKTVAKTDHLQADHDLFLQAFEKPTQIYRFLRNRNMFKPIYLNRTLSYMRHRMSRSHKPRSAFKVDSMLEKVVLKNKSEQSHHIGEYMTLTFLGFYDHNINNDGLYVKVEAVLLKLCHKKRKDSSSAGDEITIGCCSVLLNPSASSPPLTTPALSISSETFSPSQGPDVKSYVLMLQVSYPQQKKSDDSDSEPAFKKAKLMDGFHRVLGCELVVYDKHNRCLLKSGEYDLVLKETIPQVRSPHKGLPTHWETLREDNIDISGDNNPFDVFKLKPTLKLKLGWSSEPSNGMVSRPKPFTGRDPTLSHKNGNGDQANTDNNNCNKENSKPSSNFIKLNGVMRKPTDDPLHKSLTETGKSENFQIIYQFLYNNNSRQQTEACEDLHCPWCSLDCGRLYALLKHLKLCHSRFNFTYHEISNGARIDVSINDSYDGSYSGSPHWACVNGGIRGGSGPGRRAPLTQTLVCHPPRRHHLHYNNLAEFKETEDNDLTMDGQRPYISGHNRLYNHTISCLPVNPKELEVDSEGETDPLWLQQKTMMMIDEFTDVNEGEKELMKMWNLHIMKYNFVGDCQIPLACKMFVETRGRELLEKNLYRNFVLHMCSLHDFGLITAVVMYNTIQLLNHILTESEDVKHSIRRNILAQRDHWKLVGMHQQPSLEPKPLHSKPPFIAFNGDSSPAVRRKMNYTQAQPHHSGSETKKKADSLNGTGGATSQNNSADVKDSVKKNVNPVAPSTSKNSLISPQVVLRRKSVGSNQLSSVTKKRLSLQERKNST